MASRPKLGRLIAIENNAFTYGGNGSVIQDIVFGYKEASIVFAVGNAGVFYTLNNRTWQRLLDTTAVPSHPVPAENAIRREYL